MSENTDESSENITHFSVQGNYISNLIRERCIEGGAKHAWEIFASLMPPEGMDFDAVGTFQSLIKGKKTFNGTNELSLDDCEKENLTLPILEQFRLNKRNPIESFHQLGQRELDEEDLEDDDRYEFDVEAYNKRVEEQEKKRIEELTFFMTKMNLTAKQVEDMYLSTIHSEDYGHKNGGWLTDKGYFLPVNHELHDATFHSLSDRGYTFSREVGQIERVWLRISNDSNNGQKYLRDSLVPKMNEAHFNFNLTAKQKLTLEKIIRARGFIKEGESMQIHGYGFVHFENNQLRFEKEHK